MLQKLEDSNFSRTSFLYPSKRPSSFVAQLFAVQSKKCAVCVVGDGVIDTGICRKRYYFEIWQVKDSKVYSDAFSDPPRNINPFDYFADAGYADCTFGETRRTGKAVFVPKEKWDKVKAFWQGRLERGGNAGVRNAICLYG